MALTTKKDDDEFKFSGQNLWWSDGSLIIVFADET